MLAFGPATPATPVAGITAADVRRAIPQAATYWSGLDQRALEIRVGELAGSRLAATIGQTVVVDTTAAGHGWATAGGTMDLVSVLAHEFGHVLGHSDIHSVRAVDKLMNGWISPGQRSRR